MDDLPKISRFERIIHKINLLALQLFARGFGNKFLLKQRDHIENKWAKAYTPSSNLLLPLLRADTDNPEHFAKYLFLRREPILFPGAAKNWNCTQRWNTDFFDRTLGDHDVLLLDAEGLTGHNTNQSHEFLAVKSLIKNIKSGGDKYLRFSPLLQENPHLLRDLDFSWLKRATPKSTFGNTHYMFIGGKGSCTHLHSDQPCNLYIQISGRKRWRLYPASETYFIYPEIERSGYVKSRVNLAKPDFEKFPLVRSARYWEVILEPGDILYIPPHTWHFVENLSETIAIAYRFSHLNAALRSSVVLTIIRLLSMNPPIWKTMEYGKIDTNLIWAKDAEKLMKEKLLRQKNIQSAKT